jgi:hypothetical protein
LLHGNGAHVSIVRVVAIGMMQPDVYAKIDPVILWVPPASVNDLVCIRRGIDGTIGYAEVHAVMAVVPDPAAKTVGPVPAAARVTYARLRRWRSRRRRHRTVLIRHVAGICNDAVISCVVRRGMIEDGFL